MTRKTPTAEHRPATRRRLYTHDVYTACELFSGFGGLSKGIQDAGFTEIVAANHNRYKTRVHEANNPETEHWIADLVDTESPTYHDARDLPAATLLAAGVSCFAAGTLVLTRRGLIPIEKVQVGDEVWTHRSRWRAVTSTSAAERPTVTVNATAPITCTPDHPFWAAVGRRDYQPRRKYQPLAGARCLECGGPAPRFRAGSVARLFCSRDCSQAAANRRALDVLGEPEDVRADSLAGMYVGAPVLSHDGAELPTIDGLGDVTPGIAWMLGRWAGDGWLTRRPERGDVWSRVTICASHAESDDLARQLADLTGLPWNRTRQRTADTFHVDRQGLAAFIANNFGHGAAGKRIPAWLLFAPEDIRQAFTDGYVAADGHVSRSGLRLQTASVSKELTVGTRLLLTSLGYYVSVHHGRRAAQVVIEGRTVRQRWTWTVTAHKCRDRRPKHRDADGYRWGKASGTVTPSGTVTVYNMTVEEDHTYVADGVIVHNCTNHSQANSQKAYEQGLALFDLEDPDYDARVTRSERDRATANCVLAYARVHHPLVILVECTTQLASWGPGLPGRPKVGDGSTYRWWLKQFDIEGYNRKILYLNSMFFGVPQSRDRGYWVFYDKRLPAPDLEHRPVAWCDHCQQAVEGVWTWRTGVPPTGKVCYGEQYNYRCPRCRSEVFPAVTPSLDALDLTNLGTRIGDKPVKRHRDGSTGPMAASTMERAERCRQRAVDFPAVLVPSSFLAQQEGHPWQPAAEENLTALTGSVIAGHRHNGDGQHIASPMDTVTATHEKAALTASTGMVMGAAGNTFERPGSNCRSRGLNEPLWTQPATNSFGLLAPPRAVAVDNYQGSPRGADEPLPTQGGSETFGVLSSGVIPLRKGSAPVAPGEPLPTATGSQTLGMLTAAGMIRHNGSIDEARYRAHPVSDPLGTVVSTAVTQAALFSGWYKQNGSTSRETAPHPLLDPFGTLTGRDTTAVLTVDWNEYREVVSRIPLEDWWYKMLGPHEVGRGCGFDVSFPGYHYEGTFIVWGSARDQVDGYGNACSPQVGEWIGSRLRASLDTAQGAA